MKMTLHVSPFALDIFIKPPHPNSPLARDHKKNKVDKTDKKKPTKEQKK